MALHAASNRRIDSSASAIAQLLPWELLSDVFLPCLPNDRFARVRTFEAPLNVSHVCRQWRNAALQTTRLWAGLHLTCRDGKSTIKYIFPFLREFLRRSGEMHVFIKLQVTGIRKYGVYNDANNTIVTVLWEHMEVLLKEISEHAVRLKSLSLIMPQIFSSQTIQIIQNEKFSINSLGLHFHGAASVVHRHMIQRWISACSNLVELDIGGSTQVDIDVKACPQFQKLRKLVLSCNIDTWSLAGILHRSPSIEDLRLHETSTPFRCYKGRELLRESDCPTSFSSIRRFEINGNDHLYRESLKLGMPGLTTLILDLPTTDTALDWVPGPVGLSDFLERLKCPLETLILRAVPMAEEETADSLRLVPKLKHLHICMSDFMESLLTLSGARSDTCPLLETISFGQPLSSHRDWLNKQTLAKAADAVVRSPWTAPGNLSTDSSTWVKILQAVILPSSDEVTQLLFSMIEDCVRQGLAVLYEDT